MTGPLKNSRHERFAQELAKGKSQLEAYEAAGYKPNESHASRLVANGKVSVRLEELKAKAAERTVITVESLTARLLAIAAKGEGKTDAPMLSVARASIMDAAKLNGLIIDRTKHGIDLSGLSAEDLDALDRILGKTANA